MPELSDTASPTHVEISMSSGNILCDVGLPKYDPQATRLPGLINSINSMKEASATSETYIQYLCEGSGEDALHRIATETDACLVGDPVEYYNGAHMAFIADKHTAAHARTEFVQTQSRTSKLGFMTLQLSRMKIAGIHTPYRPYGKDKVERNTIIDTSLVVLDAPDIDVSFLFGDGNIPHFFPKRKSIVAAGYVEAHANARPPYPNPGWRGKSTEWKTPRTSIDIMMAKGEGVTLVDSGFVVPDDSDHPTPWANYLIPQEALQ